MDLGDLAALVTACGTVLIAAGAGVRWLISRQDRREDAALSRMEAELARAEAEIDALKALNRLVLADGQAWLMQLVKAGIDPVPPEWRHLRGERHGS